MWPKNHRGSAEGFSLIELLIVVLVLAVIAAVAIPNLRQSRAAANEVSAITYMKSWVQAQEVYRMRHGVYADDVDELLVEKLIQGRDASNVHGYEFSMDQPSGSTVEWWGRGEPTTPGVTGNRRFFLDNSGVIRYSTSGSATSASPPL